MQIISHRVIQSKQTSFEFSVFEINSTIIEPFHDTSNRNLKLIPGYVKKCKLSEDIWNSHSMIVKKVLWRWCVVIVLRCFEHILTCCFKHIEYRLTASSYNQLVVRDQSESLWLFIIFGKSNLVIFVSFQLHALSLSISTSPSVTIDSSTGRHVYTSPDSRVMRVE